MKLLRLKITDPAGFRSLPSGFEFHFRTEWTLQDELSSPEVFAPFVCAGPNGSGKSNLLEALAAIFYQLEVQRVQRNFLPPIFYYDAVDNPDGIKASDGSPNAYELEYMIRVPEAFRSPNGPDYAHVRVLKNQDESPWLTWINIADFVPDPEDFRFSTLTDEERSFLLPQYVLGYSSGENEVLSLSFFKMRFIQYDEYWKSLTRQLPYAGRPDTRMAYLDSSFSQAILLSNLLFQDQATLRPFREDVGIEALKEFRIVLRRSIPIQPDQLDAFDTASDDQRKERSNRVRAQNLGEGESEIEDLIRREIVKGNPALYESDEQPGGGRYRVNLLQLLQGGEESSLIVSALQRCATLSYVDEASDTLVLDYWVNDVTKQAFHENFDRSPLALFQAFQVLLTLNLYSVSDALKADIYRSSSHYVSETVPTLASDERIMRFKFARFSKKGVASLVTLKELSDGEHQLLHSLGLCLLFRNSNGLFLLDEPETHFNPGWRANFISRLRQCLPGSSDVGQEMLITTHAPFLISDSKPDKVLVFDRDEVSGAVSVSPPGYNTLGASINKITMTTFNKGETIGAYAKGVLDQLRARFNAGNEEPHALIGEINRELGDSVEKMLLVKEILDKAQGETTRGRH